MIYLDGQGRNRKNDKKTEEGQDIPEIPYNYAHLQGFISRWAGLDRTLADRIGEADKVYLYFQSGIQCKP